jgi:ADP-ribose pyrophosphatase
MMKRMKMAPTLPSPGGGGKRSIKDAGAILGSGHRWAVCRFFSVFRRPFPRIPGMIQPWKKIGSKVLGDFRIFKLRSDLYVSPRTGKEHDFFVLDSVNWVNVIALTPDGRLVMVEQYRPGSNTVELEIPGGMMDAADSGPAAAAARELREETGYEGENARVLGRIHSNPAILNNITYTVLIENCRLLHPTQMDHAEDLATRLVPSAEIPKLVAGEKIGHSLVVVALYHFDLWRRGIKKLGEAQKS